MCISPLVDFLINLASDVKVWDDALHILENADAHTHRRASAKKLTLNMPEHMLCTRSKMHVTQFFV